jgi:hypothetical protein
MANAEKVRLDEARTEKAPWRKWGPYLSERQWGTVREDQSDTGAAWDSFSHDQARSRAYQWGEDGLAGFSDDKQRLCFALALWNGKDPILKERLFGLTNSEGNHGEDVKEYYYYLDSTPTHSYCKYLYKYPQQAYPYDDLVETNRTRTRTEPEYELIDTGVFDQDRYFDVFVEFAKASPEEILIRLTAKNRGPEAAKLHLLPSFWFRKTWSDASPPASKPKLRAEPSTPAVVEASHPELGALRLHFSDGAELLFTENESNETRLSNKPNATPYVKDAFHEHLVAGRTGAVNPEKEGTKMAAHYELLVPAQGEVTVCVRIARDALAGPAFGPEFEAVLAERIEEADAFYAEVIPPSVAPEERRVMRQAYAGMLWGKQYYYFDVSRWLTLKGANPGVRRPRNSEWAHMVNDDVISMPDKWEYPWYAAWDLAFHTIALDPVDSDFAKKQLILMLEDTYQHPGGQLPAYEWNFGDVNPPVHAFAALFTYNSEKRTQGQADGAFLQRVFHKLLLNFSWWANRKDPMGRNLFDGGFLGLDNIGVFDRSAPLPTGGFLEQADGTAWMAMFCQQMFEMAMEISRENPVYEGLAARFLEQFLRIAGSMDRVGDNADELWDAEDGFFYDLLHLPGGKALRLKVRSMVGLLPLCAATAISSDVVQSSPYVKARMAAFLERHPELRENIHPLDRPGYAGRHLLAVCGESKLRQILARMLDEERFLSPFGLRSLSRHHLENPYEFLVHGERYVVKYLPGESDSGMFGGNSNWRGPIWMPVNLLVISALIQYYLYYGDEFKVECPTGSGNNMTLFEVAQELARRLTSIFLPNEKGERPVFGGASKFQNDPHFKDHILYYEYFHGDTGAGLGASHQTGWTGLVARLAGLRLIDSKWLLEVGVHGVIGGLRTGADVGGPSGTTAK